ncbi:MAG: class I SAM-dependent methyltransferase [Solirubrobacterales bacterium]|nr:class I SAM-dependent methyltransferase [Solirubrobacterales bacterium]
MNPGSTESHESADSYEAAAFGRLERIEARSFWFRSRNRLIEWLFRRHFPDAESFLEVGCGTGFVLLGMREAFPALELEGIEPFPEGAEIARRRLPEVPIVETDAANLPPAAEFDVVGCFDVLEHIEDDPTALRGMFDALKPGGGLLLSVPQHPWLWSAADEYAHHQRRYRRPELVERVNDAGFEVLRVGSFMTLTLPLMVLSRIGYVVRPARRNDPLGDLELPPPINRSLDRLLSVEQFFLRRGWNPRFGGSLFLVARRPPGSAGDRPDSPDR